MTTTATFTIDLRPAEPLLESGERFTFTKTWSGALEGQSTGVMLTAGEPSTGDAGYVAAEVFEGTLRGARGTLAFHQLGAMSGGDPSLTYAIAPGSGTGELAGTTGALEIGEIEESGRHHVTLTLETTPIALDRRIQ